MAAQEQSWGVVEPEEQGRKLQKQTNTKQVSNYGFNSCTGLTLFAFEDLDFTCRNNHRGRSGGHDVRRGWRQWHHVDARSGNHWRHRSDDLAWRETNHRSHRWSRNYRYGREERGAYRRRQLLGKKNKIKQSVGIINAASREKKNLSDIK